MGFTKTNSVRLSVIARQNDGIWKKKSAILKNNIVTAIETENPTARQLY